MFDNRHAYADWKVPGSDERALSEDKARLKEVAALVETASQAQTPEEMYKAFAQIRLLVNR